jgi:hypothetical protein
MKNKTRISAVLALGLGATLAGCGDSTSGNPNANANPNVGTPINYQHGGDGTTSTAASAGLSYTVGTGSLVDPTVDYMQALRTASLKLRGTLPSLDEQLRLQSIVSTGTANDAQLQYESMVRGYIYNSPATFNRPKSHLSRLL